MNENWCAFCISILKNITPEQSFLLFDNGKLSRNNRSISKDEVSRMKQLKKKMTYAEIGLIYGISANAVFRRIQYANKKSCLSSQS